MDHYAWILCVVFLPVVFSQDIGLTGNCSNDDSDSLEVWGTQRDDLSCQLFEVNSCNDADLPPNVGGDFMGPPQTMEVDGTLYRNETSGIRYPQIVITWTPPATASGFQNLKGFYVKIQTVIAGYPQPVCRVLDFSQNNFTTDDYQLTFRKKLLGFEGGINHLYELQLYTLPMSTASKSQSQLFKLQSIRDGTSPGHWSAAVSYTKSYPTAPARITARFSLAPKDFGFTKYIFKLLGERDTHNYLEICEISTVQASTCQGKTYDKPADNATSITITFTVDVADTYTIRLEPDDPYWNDPNRCLCYEKNSDTTRSCIRCITTTTGDISVAKDGGTSPTTHTGTTGSTRATDPIVTLPGGTSPTTHTGTTGTTRATDPIVTLPGGTSPTAHTGTTGTTRTTDPIVTLPVSAAGIVTSEYVTTLVASLVGGLVGLVCVSMVVVLLWRKQRAARNDSTFNLKSEHLVKKVYLLHAEDHKEHINVITNLAIYLKDHCNCKVFFLPWYRGAVQTTGVYQWIITHIDQADYVIVISSEAAFNLFDSRSTNISYRAEDEGPEGDSFSPAMTHVMAKSSEPGFFKKTILVYFEYTKEDFVLKEISPGVQYKLPKHFREMVCHIHGINAENGKQINGMDNLQATTGGRNFLETVTKAKHFEKSDPGWFGKRFKRHDSAYGSEHDEAEVEDSVSMKARPVYVNDAYDYDDEFKSAVTYNTAYDLAHLEDIAPPSEVATDTSTNYINMQFQSINMANGGPQRESFDFFPPSETSTHSDTIVNMESI